MLLSNPPAWAPPAARAATLDPHQRSALGGWGIECADNETLIKKKGRERDEPQCLQLAKQIFHLGTCYLKVQPLPLVGTQDYWFN